VIAAPVIRVVDAGKRYTKYEDQPMLVDRLRFRGRTRRSHLWAVRNVGFDVARGECVGVIGRNGSGKSTMLKMLAGVTGPSEGSLVVRGRIAPLVSVGVGFHPELTGRENVYLNATILGMTKRQVDEKLDSIIAFSEIGSFIDTPVKFYSSGMFVRLGLSVAIHAEPSVLLVDEVLAVGDFAFQMKCFERMMAVRESGTTVVVVSHNLNAVRQMCERTILLHDGAMQHDGTTADAISLYHEMLGESRELDDLIGEAPLGGDVECEDLTLLGPDGSQTHHLHTGDIATVRITTRFDRAVDNPVFGILVRDRKERPVYTDHSRVQLGRVEAGETVTLDVRLDMRLVTGSYMLRVNCRTHDLDTYLMRSNDLHFYVSGRQMVGGVTDLGADFQRVEVAAR